MSLWRNKFVQLLKIISYETSALSFVKIICEYSYFLLQETKPRGLKGLDNDLLFDEVMKKSLVYSQKYNANLTKQSGPNKNQLILADKRLNYSAKSDLSVNKKK